VIRDVTAPLDLEHVQPIRIEEMLPPATSAERDDWRVLEQQQHVVIEPARDAIGRERALPLECFDVGRETREQDFQFA
jgi:hypothetical protein